MRAFYIAGAIATVALLIVDSLRKYRATGRIPVWWFLFGSPWTLISRTFFENYPEYRYSRQERRIVKIVVRCAVIILVASTLWIPAGILVLTLLGAEDDYSKFLVIPALGGFLASGFVLLLRWMLFLSGHMPGDSEK